MRERNVLGLMPRISAAPFFPWITARPILSPAVGNDRREISFGETHSLEDLARAAGNVDLVYEATGASRLAFDMMKFLGPNGIFIFTGVPGRRGPVEVDTDLIMRNLVLKNQVIFGTVNAGRDAFEAAIRDIDIFSHCWPQAVSSLITGRFPTGEYRDLLLGPSSGIKNVVELD
jgi:threonine dehydrogenase-like Zn-dependent dehydrogenase